MALHGGLAGASADRVRLASRTLEWSLAFLDCDRHLVWNPSWYDAAVPARTVHLVPGSAWTAYGLLARRAPGDLDEAVAILGALLALQYDAPGEPFDGTFAAFVESPEPPAGRAEIWRDYDPNWRQFLGTTFVLVLEDFAHELPQSRAPAREGSVARAVHGEPEDRIALDYTNPGLMHAFLLAWHGRRADDAVLVGRGEQLGRAIVRRFDELGAFDEHNSPTYYGIDLLALALWHEFAPTPFFSAEGRRLSRALWTETLERYNPMLRNWCGPYTRSYGPDATRSVTLLGLWYEAAMGEELAPLPALPPPGGGELHHAELHHAELHHANDVMAGPVVARLARAVPGHLAQAFASSPGAAFASSPGGDERQLRWRVGERDLSAWVTPSLMIGAESSERDWSPSGQAVPVCVHWLEAPCEASGVATLWMSGAHVIHAETAPHVVTVVRPSAAPDEPLVLALSGAAPSVDGATLHTSAATVLVTGDVTRLEVRRVVGDGSAAEHEILVLPPPGTAAARVSLRFELRGRDGECA
ncbi:MAG: hypothetical protein ACYCR4_07950 [Acidimicrobiales bacterium]